MEHGPVVVYRDKPVRDVVAATVRGRRDLFTHRGWSSRRSPQDGVVTPSCPALAALVAASMVTRCSAWGDGRIGRSRRRSRGVPASFAARWDDPVALPSSCGTAGGRAIRTVSPMFVSYVVRLKASQLERGSFVGEVEGVATGDRHAIGSLEQMAAYMMQTFVREQRASTTALAGLHDHLSELS